MSDPLTLIYSLLALLVAGSLLAVVGIVKHAIDNVTR
jgi:hypothetical protein